MLDFPYDLIGFDLDGTLVDSSEDLAAAVNHVLARLNGAPLTIEQIRRNIGGGGRRMLAQSLADAGVAERDDFDSLYQTMLAYYAEHIADATRPYPGVTEALDQLAAEGARLAVVTNKAGWLATKLLDALDLSAQFTCVIGGDDVAKGKPAPDPIFEMVRRTGARRPVFVGDSEFDVAAAHAAGLPCVAVSFGFPGKPIGELGADAVIDHFAALPDTLRRLAQAGR
jgi:phosphoglycolate phosphatase